MTPLVCGERWRVGMCRSSGRESMNQRNAHAVEARADLGDQEDRRDLARGGVGEVVEELPAEQRRCRIERERDQRDRVAASPSPARRHELTSPERLVPPPLAASKRSATTSRSSSHANTTSRLTDTMRVDLPPT